MRCPRQPRALVYQLLALALGPLCFLSSCSGGASTANAAPTAPSPPAATAPRRTAAYPPGLWRLAPEVLNRVALPIERIVVAHEEIAPDQLEDFSPELRSSRAKQAARELVRQIRAELAGDPSSFAERARRYSDDSVTRDWGGAQGVVRATLLADEVADATEVLDPGSISEPLDTPIGYQLVRLVPDTRPQEVSGQAIIVKYSGTRGWSKPGLAAQRTRADARDLALQLAVLARQAPVDFDRLVAIFSDDAEFDATGFLGVRNTHGGMSDALLLSVLARLELGETSNVLDTDRGFMVLKRLPLPEGGAIALAMTAIAIPYRFDQPDSSNRTALGRANALLEARASDPAGFRDYCVGVVPPETCSLETWTRGQGSAALERALLQLAIGQSVVSPVPTPFGYHVLRREDPSQRVEPPETLAFRMYREPQPSVVALLERAPREIAAGLVQAQTREFIARSGMPDPMSTELQRIVQALAAKLVKDPPDDRSGLHARFRDDLGKAFGPELVRSYEQFAEQRLYAHLNQ